MENHDFELVSGESMKPGLLKFIIGDLEDVEWKWRLDAFYIFFEAKVLEDKYGYRHMIEAATTVTDRIDMTYLMNLLDELSNKGPMKLIDDCHQYDFGFDELSGIRSYLCNRGGYYKFLLAEVIMTILERAGFG